MRQVLVVIGLLLGLGLGSISVTFGIRDLISQRELREHSETVQGTVVRFDSKCYSNRRRTGVTYTFTTRDGRELRSSDLVEPRTRCQLREDGPVTVQYLVGDPTTNQIPEDGDKGGYLLCIVGVFSIVVVLVMAALELVPRKADRTSPEHAPGSL